MTCKCKTKNCLRCAPADAPTGRERRTDPLRPRAAKVLGSMGVKLEESLQAFMAHVIRTGQLPFPLMAVVGVQEFGKTPRCDRLEAGRVEMGQQYTPAYAEALILARDLEREVIQLREALSISELEVERLEDRLERVKAPYDNAAPNFRRTKVAQARA